MSGSLGDSPTQLPTHVIETIDDFEVLVPSHQSQAVLFDEDPSHPSLRFKQVHSTRPIFSARVTLNHPTLAVRKGDTWIWFWIGSHSDYDTLLERL